MTKDELRNTLEQFEKLARDLKEAVQSDPDFKKLKGDQQVPEGATVFGLVRKSAHDERFREYARTAEAGATAVTGMVSASPDEERPEPIGFGQFMERLSESVVSTQEKLDSESARYLGRIKDKKHIQPAVFRLPKVSAEMRFALEVDREKGLNFLFFSNKEKNVSRNEQAIQFDIVTVPAPPDALQAMTTLAPRLSLLLDPFERSAVIAIISAATASPTLNPLIQAAQNTPHRLVILETNRQPGEYLVFFATTDTDHTVGLWKVDRSPGSQPKVVYRFAKSNGPEEVEARDVILKLADQQETFLL